MLSSSSSPTNKSRKSLLFLGSTSNKRNKGGLFLPDNNNNINNINFKKAVQILVALVLISLFGSNFLLLVRLKTSNKADNAQYPPPPSVATAVAASARSRASSSARGIRSQQQQIVIPPKSSSASNCILRQYPPHRYYKLPDQNQPDFLIGNNVEYIFGEWPIVLKDTTADTTKAKKICIHQDEWRNEPSDKLLPFADGTNPSILSIERIRKEGNSDNSLATILQAYPNAKYIATACMTNTQCSWKDSDSDKQKFRISNQSKPDVVLTLLLVLDENFATLTQSQLLLKRDAIWGVNKRKRLSPANKLHRPQLDDARLFIFDGKVWLSYREGGLFGYETQVLNPLHYDVVINKGNELGSVHNNIHNQKFRAWLNASETSSFCCGRNMALMEIPSTSNRLQSLTWVDPVTVIDVDTTPFHQVDTQNKKANQRRHRKLLHDMVHDEAKNQPVPPLPQPQLLLHHRRLQQKKKKKKSHVHGTNGFMVYLPADDVFLGVAHIHRPHDRDSNPYARHGHHYTHAFFTISASKPYHLRSLSQEFVLPSISNPNDGEIIQFLSGLEIVYDNNNDNNNNRKNGKIVIAYGINDCEAAVTTVSLSYVLEKLLRPVDAGKEVVDYMESLDKK